MAYVLLTAACGGGGGGGGGGSTPSNLPDLVVTAFSAPSSGVAGQTYTVTGTITNQGGVPGVTGAIIYLSPFSDVERDGGHVGLEVYMGFLAPGQSWNFSVEIDLPDNVASGSYYIGVVSPYAPGSETNTANNVRSQAFTITGGTTCAADSYEADNSNAAAKSLAFGETQQHNHCDSTSDWLSFSATSGQAYGIMTSQVGGWTALSLYGPDGQTLLASGTPDSFDFSAARLSWTAPASGTYYLRVWPVMGPYSGGANTDYDITLGDQRPDLYISSFWSPSSGYPGGIISVSNTVRNQGFTAAGSFTVSLYLSADATVTTSDTLLGSRTVNALAVNATSNVTENFTLPANLADGTYYIAAIANPDGAVNELVTTNNTNTPQAIAIAAPTNCSADTYEQDDTQPNAKPLTVGAAAQAHNHCEDSEDWLSFAATSGTNYAIRVARVGGYAETYVQLYGTDGTTLLSSASTSTTSIDWQAPASGTYYLRLRAPTFRPGTDYTVKVDPTLADLTQAMTVSNGVTSVVAGGILMVHDTVTNVGHVATGAFEIGFYASTDATVTTVDTFLGTRAITSLGTYGSGSSSNENWYTAVQVPRALTAGTYYLAGVADRSGVVTEVSETNNTSTPVTINVVAPTNCTLDTYEDDDSPATAKPITNGETQVRNRCDDSLDWIRFTPSESGAYVATGTSNIAVYQSDGTTLAPLQDTHFYDKLSWTATAGNTYYIKVYGSDITATSGGSYQFQVYRCTQDSYEEDDTLATAKPITVGQTQSRNHCEDGYDWASFSAAAGTTYTISVTNGDNKYMTLYRADGSSVASGQPAQGGKKKVITWTAQTSGTYYIETRPIWGFGQNSDYDLTLQ